MIRDQGLRHIAVIRIVHIIRGLPIGGAEMMLMKLLRSMDDTRFTQTVISLDDHGDIGTSISTLGVPVYCLGIKTGGDGIRGLWKLRGIIQHVRPDLIQGWMYHGNLATLIGGCLAQTSVPVVWRITSSVYSLSAEKRMTALLVRLGACLSKTPAAITYCSWVSVEQHEAMGYRNTQRHVISDGFDCEQFKPMPDARPWLRQELGYARNTLLIGLIARYHPMKDHKNFLQAAGLVAKRCPDVGFILVGNGIDDRNHELVEVMESSGISDQVRFLGQRTDIAKIMAELDIVTSSSWSESFPNVIGEAMACGIPCVVTDVGASSLIVGKTGIVVPPRDPNALAQGCEQLIDAGEEGRRTLGRAARARIVERFSLAYVARAYENLYETIVVGAANSHPHQGDAASSSRGG